MPLCLVVVVSSLLRQSTSRLCMYEEDLLSRVHQDEAKLAYKWEHWAAWDAQRRRDDQQHTSLLEQRRRKGESTHGRS